MPSIYEILEPDGHKQFAEDIFTKIKGYLDTHGVDSKVSKSGDTMTGDLSWNGSTGFNSGLYWKEHGYGDQFKIYPQFSGADDNNYLTIATAVGGADTQPELSEKFKFYPSGKLELSNVIVPSRSITYIAGAKGNAGLYAKKAYNVDAWYPAVCLQTKGGGSWQIGNYNSENLQFAYATKANIDANKNEVSIIHFPNNVSGTIYTSGNKPSAADVGALPISGGTMTGAIGFNNATTRRNTAKNLTSENVTSPGYVVGLTDSWGTFGYTTIAQLKAKFGYGSIVTKNAGDYPTTTTLPSGYRVRAGSVVKLVNASAGTHFTVFTQAELNSHTGLSNRGPGNTVVWITNGDIGAAGANITRQGFYGNNYVCTFSISYSNQYFRFNYIIIAW